MQDNLIQYLRSEAEMIENTRVRQALDNVNANVMIADTDGSIIYLNEAAVKLMQHAESDLQQDLNVKNVLWLVKNTWNMAATFAAKDLNAKKIALGI